MVRASICNMRNAFSEHSNACTAGTTFRELASGWPPSSGSSRGMAVGFGLRRGLTPGPRFSLRSRSLALERRDGPPTRIRLGSDVRIRLRCGPVEAKDNAVVAIVGHETSLPAGGVAAHAHAARPVGDGIVAGDIPA